MSLELQAQDSPNALILNLKGRLDSVTCSELENRLMEHVNQAEQAIILDFSALDYIASAGLRIILMAVKRAKQKNTTFVLCALQPQIHHVFEISGFLKIMQIFQTQDEALKFILEQTP